MNEKTREKDVIRRLLQYSSLEMTETWYAAVGMKRADRLEIYLESWFNRTW